MEKARRIFPPARLFGYNCITIPPEHLQYPPASGKIGVNMKQVEIPDTNSS